MKHFTRLEAAEEPRFDRGLVFLALACAAIALPVAFNPAVFNDGDTSWHLAAGRLMLDQLAIPDSDPFSFTHGGAPWVAHEWLAEIVMAVLFRLGGWAALALMTALSLAALLGIVGREALRFLSPLPAVGAVVLVALVLMPFTLARPHVLAWPLLAAWTAMLLRARERDGAPGPWAALLMLAWANLHGSFLMGLALAAFFGFEALVYSSNRTRVVKTWTPFAVATLVGSLATPHGLQALLFPLQVSGMESLPLIGEWKATDFRLYPLFGIALLTALVVGASRRNAISALRLLLLVALAYLAIEHVRHQAVFAIVGCLVLMRAAAARPTRVPRMSIAMLAAVLAAWVGASLLRVAVPMQRLDSASNPITALAAIPPELRGRPVLNSYSFGGPLILAGFKPYIDGRADMYGDAFMFEHRRLMAGDLQAFRNEAERRMLAWTILSPLDPLSRKLDSETGWRRIYSDRWAVVHVRS